MTAMDDYLAMVARGEDEARKRRSSYVGPPATHSAPRTRCTCPWAGDLEYPVTQHIEDCPERTGDHSGR